MTGDEARALLAAALVQITAMTRSYADGVAAALLAPGGAVDAIVRARTAQLEADLAHARSAGESYRRQRDALWAGDAL